MNSKHRVQHPKSTLVIGYGNELRGDDAAGPLVARAVAEWDVLARWHSSSIS